MAEAPGFLERVDIRVIIKFTFGIMSIMAIKVFTSGTMLTYPQSDSSPVDNQGARSRRFKTPRLRWFNSVGSRGEWRSDASGSIALPPFLRHGHDGGFISRVRRQIREVVPLSSGNRQGNRFDVNSCLSPGNNGTVVSFCVKHWEN